MRVHSYLLSLLFLFLFIFCVPSYADDSIQDTCPYVDAIFGLYMNLFGMWRENRERLVSLSRPNINFPSVVFLSGDDLGADDRFPFRQNSNFYYLTGTNVPGYFVSLLITKNSVKPFTTLFVPVPSADYPIWNGNIQPNSALQKLYDVDAVVYTNETTNYVDSLPADTTVYTIPSSVPLPAALSQLTINTTFLQPIMTTSRATKSYKEIQLMTLVNQITSYAHINTMKFVSSRINNYSSDSSLSNDQFGYFMRNRAHGSVSSSSAVPMDDIAKNHLSSLSPIVSESPFVPKHDLGVYSGGPILYEFQVESIFLYYTGLCGALLQSYLPIVGAANDASYLHYTQNNNQISSFALVLVDAGCEYWGYPFLLIYGSDVTRTYPANGVFTDQQKLIYNIVLQTQADVVAIVKPQVTWATLNQVARESITRYLLRDGVIQGEFNDLMNNSVYNIFYPHGIGHSVGLDVHDSQTTTIEENQIITVEPGVYFNSFLLNQALVGPRSKFVVWDVVNYYIGRGGVRIEDDYVVTSTGSRRITSVPSSIEEIEQIMKS